MQACSETVFKFGYGMAKKFIALSSLTGLIRSKIRTSLVGTDATVRTDLGLYKKPLTSAADLLATEDPEWRAALARSMLPLPICDFSGSDSI